MFTDTASLFPVIIDGLTCGARRQITSWRRRGGGLLITDHALFYRHYTKHNLGKSAQRVKNELVCFKKPLKSDFEKSEKLIHNTQNIKQSKDKASKTQPPRHAQVVDNEKQQPSNKQ